MKHGSGALLSLASQKALSFSRDGGAEAVWRGSASLAEGDAGNCSVAISSSSDDAGVEEDENSGLKERDYIGLAKVSSPVKPVPGPNELSLSETDLQLGLGLGLGLSMKASGADDSEKTLPFPITQTDGLPQVAMDTPKYAFTGSGHTSQKPWPNAAGSMRPMTADNISSSIVSSAREFQSPKASIHAQEFSGEGPSSVGSTFYGGNPNSALKNGTKRGYTEAMNEAARFNMVTVIPTAAATKNGDGDAKNPPNHQQGTFIPNWVPSKPTLPAHWQDGLEQSSVHSFTPNKPAPVTTVPRVEKPVADHAAAARKPNVPCEAAKEPASNDPPPSKGQVVGWPPVCSYRRHNLSKPTEMFVKVNMDGMTVGRKVDLNAHSSYEGLFSALEEMFQPSNNGGQGTPQVASGRENHANNMKQFRLLHGSEYVLTYEDQEGDWMLVGDVPWSMFVNLVRRLRITHGSEATGLAPRRPVKTK